MKTFTASFILVIWLVAGLFFGVGGLTKLNADEKLDELKKNKDPLIAKVFNPPLNVDGITINNQYEYQVYKEETKLETYFLWTLSLPPFSALIITAMSFGLLGTIIGLFRQISLLNKPVIDVNYMSLPLLGLLTGLVVLGLSFLLPTLIAKGTTEIRPLTLMFLCLFCGISTDAFYKKIETSFDKLFTGK